MKKYFNYIVVLLIALCFLTFTAPSCNPVQVDYKSVSVPQEGNVKFVQFTSDNESVVCSYVTPVQTGNRYGLQWDGSSFLGLNSDGNTLAYIKRENNKDNIYLKSTIGGKSTTQRTFSSSNYSMSFSPDNKSIAFQHIEDGSYNIYLINTLQGSAIQQITSTNSDETAPAFSPDGSLIFFTKRTTQVINNVTYSSYSIWSFNTKSSLLTQYTEGLDANPLPDGKNILITRYNKNNGNGEIWMINLENGQESMILGKNDRDFTTGRISPDGKRIVCVGATQASATMPINLDLFLLNLDGTNLTQLTFHGGHDLSPVWSPDGKSIYFISQRGSEKGAYNVWNMDISYLVN